MEGLNKFCKIKTIILKIFGEIFGQTRETVEYKYIEVIQIQDRTMKQYIVVRI